MKRRIYSNSGFTMIEALFGVAGIGIVAILTMKVSAAKKSSMLNIEQQQNIKLTRQYVREFMSCEKTIQNAPQNCRQGSFIAAYNHEGQQLFNKEGTTVFRGKFLVRASCQNEDLLVHFKETGSKANWRNLFNNIPITCANTVTPQPSAPMLNAKAGCNSMEQISFKRQREVGRCSTGSSSRCTYSGAYWREERGYSLGFEVVGKASNFKIEVESSWGGKGFLKQEMRKSGNRPPIFQTAPVVINADRIKFKENTYRFTTNDIPSLSKARHDTWVSRMIKIRVTALDSMHRQVGASCLHTMRMKSPITLDLRGDNQLSFSYENKNRVLFDLDGNGTKEITGWMAPNFGLLAWDRNRNGKIDNGKELFGQYNFDLNGLKRENGYESLATFDSNSDGVIDKNDEIYISLKVWQDSNYNGVSEPGELKSLSEWKISSLSLNYKSTPSNQLSHVNLGQNAAPLTATITAAHCPNLICNSYDIFFATEETTIISQKLSQKAKTGIVR